MDRLQKAWEDWQNVIPEREAARAAAIGKVDPMKRQRLADRKAEMARLRAEIAMLTAEILQEKSTYSKSTFDAQWAVYKANRREELQNAIEEEMNVNGKSGYQLAQALGTKNINLFYEVKRDSQVWRQEQAKEALNVDWQWSRFTGTQRYALAVIDNDLHWAYVLMKGTDGTELEGEECVWDFKTGGYISGSKDVFESDTAANRRKRADTLAEVLSGTYAGKVKETLNPYFEEVD